MIKNFTKNFLSKTELKMAPKTNSKPHLKINQKRTQKSIKIEKMTPPDPQKVTFFKKLRKIHEIGLFWIFFLKDAWPPPHVSDGRFFFRKKIYGVFNGFLSFWATPKKDPPPFWPPFWPPNPKNRMIWNSIQKVN